jgi:UDP-glucose 4-epimerase
MARVLVTGGAGYIGSHTVLALSEAGHEVVIVDDMRRTSESIVDGLTVLLGHIPTVLRVDIADRDALLAAVRSCGVFDAVVHFAAYKSVRESVEHPIRYYTNNVGGTASLLEVMAEIKVHRLVFSSSCTVYGQPDVLPVTESSPIVPAASPYGFSKQICEQMIKDDLVSGSYTALTHALSLRYFNPAGAHPSALIGEVPFGVPDNLVPFITQTAAGHRDRLSIFGDDYSTPDGTAIRDYLHVCDLADAHVSAVSYLLTADRGMDVVNLGMGRGISVREAIDTFQSATGVTVPVSMAPRRSGDVEQVWSSCAKAKTLLGWETTRSLADMMTSAWAWQQHLDASAENR